MRKVFSSEMVKPLCDILAELETKGYEFTYYQSDDVPPFAVSRNEVEIIDTGEFKACDTTICCHKIRDLKPPCNSEYIIFSTHICDGIIGKGSERFNQNIDRLNCQNYLGKFVRHYRGDERAIFGANNPNDEPNIYNINKDNIPCYVLYVTNHPLSFLTLEIVESRLEYHARVKTQVTSRLEKLK
ncbi:hypothetical protein NO108_00778 [Planktothrix rubescens]|nr:hypothetical protein NO108_00778 [Planktothrix rubescens]CAH2573029.1 hypothetical protein PRNO82_02438 [Planktothrix rubescens]